MNNSANSNKNKEYLQSTTQNFQWTVSSSGWRFKLKVAEEDGCLRKRWRNSFKTHRTHLDYDPEILSGTRTLQGSRLFQVWGRTCAPWIWNIMSHWIARKPSKTSRVMSKRLMRQLEQAPISQRLNHLSINREKNFSPWVSNHTKKKKNGDHQCM